MNMGAKWVKSYGQVWVIVANGVLMRKIIFKSDVLFFFFSFQAFRVRKTDIRTLTTVAKHFCRLTANRKFNNHLVGWIIFVRRHLL